jgi:serine phosphatase RsbU (regulator of sigma subunit)
MSAAVRSRAFEEALLKSERLRIIAACFIIATFGFAAAIRIYIFGSHMSHIAVYGAVAMLVYELLVLRAVLRSSESVFRIPNWFWAVNIVVEMSMPALGVAFLASEHLSPDYRSLATPWVLLFFPFLVLSALRLSPLVSSVAGIAGGVGYLIAASAHGWHIKSDLLANPVTHSAVPFFAVMICATGFVAAVVAREIRTHVYAALREAETERQRKQLEHDLSIARSIQQSLLPKTRPSVEGFEIAGWNRSADATGGDYFDWKRLDDGRLVVTLADVTGHGIGPALLAAVCRAYARASLSNSDSLTHSLQRINEYLGEDLSPGRFATFVAAVCREGNNNVELVSAGHGPLFLYSHITGEMRDFPAHDVPLGILPRLSLESPQVVPMGEGDIVLLVTDGFLEWENSDCEQFGRLRFEQIVRSSADLPPDEIIAELYAAVLKFANGTPQQDDLTAVVIKRTASAKAAIATGGAVLQTNSEALPLQE